MHDDMIDATIMYLVSAGRTHSTNAFICADVTKSEHDAPQLRHEWKSVMYNLQARLVRVWDVLRYGERTMMRRQRVLTKFLQGV